MLYNTELHFHQRQQTFPCCWEGSPSPAALPERIPLCSLPREDPTKAPFTLGAPSTHQLPQSSSSISVSLRKRRGWASDLSCSLGAIIVELVNISFKCLHAFKKFTGLNGNKYSQGAVSCHSFAHQIPAIFKNGSVHGQAPKSFEKQ